MIVLAFILIAISPWIVYKGFSTPSFFVLIFVAFSLCRIQELVPSLESIPVAFIFASLGIISLIINLLLHKTEIYWCKEMNYFLAFFVWVSASVVFSYNFSNSFEFWHSIFLKLAIAFFLIAWTIREPYDYAGFVLICISSGLFISLLIVYNKYNAIGLVESTRATINALGIIGDPNDLALFLLLPFSFAMSLLISSFLPLTLRLFGITCALLITNGIVATQSRGGLLGIIAVGIGIFSQRIKHKSIIFILGALLIIFFYHFADIGERTSGGSLGLETGLDESASERVEAWKAAIKMGLNHPIFGVGPDNFIDNFYNYTKGMIKKNMVAHSVWFTVLSETGFIGFFFFVSCVYLAFKSIRLTIKHLENSINNSGNKMYLITARGAYFGLIGYCIAGTFLSQAYSWIFYTLFAITISLSHYTTNTVITSNDKKTRSG